MAKPIPTGLAGCSARSPIHPSTPKFDKHHRPRRRRRPPSFNSPSPALLSLLATISASTSAHGSPAPPSFLCPSLSIEPTATRDVLSHATAPSKIRRSPKLSKQPVSVRYLPDKFEIDDGGRWRRVESYTLYGSTVCMTCLDTSVPSVDDQIQGPPSSPVPNAPPTSSTTYNVRDNLPPGWKTPGSTTKSRTTLILALSLVLAFLICFLIIGCLFWRKSKRRRRKDNDIEMKARKRRREQSEEDDGRDSLLALEKEAKAKQKIWARATARWKANARYSARQRRGKRIISTTRVASPRSSSSVSLERIDEAQTTPTNPSPNISRRSSLSCPAISAGDITSSSPRPPPVEAPPDVPAPLTPNPLPPAYHLRVTSQQTHASSVATESLPPLDAYYPSSSNSRPSNSNGASVGMDLPLQSIHAAHVATDDKNLLARLADLASAPPPDGVNSSNGDSTTFHVSVPIWQDEELKDFGHGSYDPTNRSLPPSSCSSRSPSPAPLFPPPPSKGKMAAPAFYDYPYTFEDILVEPDPGPSAPPFEEPSLPVDEAALTASAPPLSDAEAAYYIEARASAPSHHEWEASSSSCEVIELAPQPAHSHIPHTSNDAEAEYDSRSIETSLSSSNHSIPLVQGPVASDGTPPSYHP